MDTPADPILAIIASAPLVRPDAPAPPEAPPLGPEDLPEDDPVPAAPDAEGCDPDTLAACALLEMNDTDNGGRLIAHFGLDLLHVREIGWHTWSGTAWIAEGGDEAVTRYAQRTARLIHLEADLLELLPREQALIERAKPLRAKASPTPGDLDLIREADATRSVLGRRRSSRRKHATTSGNNGRISAMIAQALPHKTIGPTDLDADPMAFNCRNFTLHFSQIEDPEDPGDERPNYCLKVEALPHNRADRMTKVAPVTYDPAATCPRFLAFMKRVQPDPAVRRFLQIYHGLALTGLTPQQCFLYLYGNGANGKSTFMEAMDRLMGSYADLLNAESLTGSGQRRGDQATPDFAELPGVRYLRISELPRGEGLKEALIKSLTGGEPIKARHLNKGFFTFKPVFKAVMSGNDLPTIGGLDMGIWRRVKLVPFKVMIPDGERRPMDEVLAEFEAERSGILNWLIAGLDLYYREGLITPASVSDATAAYKDEMDPIGAFAAGCLERKEGHFETARDVYEAFVSWCEANSVRPWKETAFGRAMPTKGYERENTRVRRYLNVRLHDVPPRQPRSPTVGEACGG